VLNYSSLGCKCGTFWLPSDYTTEVPCCP